MSLRNFLDLNEAEEASESLGYGISPSVLSALGIQGEKTALDFGRFLVIRSYKSYVSSFGKGSMDIIRNDIGAQIDSAALIKAIKMYQETINIKNFYKLVVDEKKQNKGDFETVLKSIKRKNQKELRQSVGESKRTDKRAQIFIISEIANKLREPPLYSSKTSFGNKTFNFIKETLGMQVAMACSICVKEAIKVEVETQNNKT